MAGYQGREYLYIKQTLPQATCWRVFKAGIHHIARLGRGGSGKKKKQTRLCTISCFFPGEQGDHGMLRDELRLGLRLISFFFSPAVVIFTHNAFITKRKDTEGVRRLQANDSQDSVAKCIDEA